MSDGLKLVLFDVDGTLVDSQHHVHQAMETAFAVVNLAPPDLHQSRKTIGLSLTDAMQQIRPELNVEMHERLARECEIAFLDQSASESDFVTAPLFDGIADLLTELASIDNVLLGVATGKSRAGLDRMLSTYQLENTFQTKQVADDHPSKPNPSMILAAMAELGVEARDTMVIGDTTFDMEMGRNAKVTTVGVSWGYHENTMLKAAGADFIIEDVQNLKNCIHEMWD